MVTATILSFVSREIVRVFLQFFNAYAMNLAKQVEIRSKFVLNVRNGARSVPTRSTYVRSPVRKPGRRVTLRLTQRYVCT